MAIALFYAFGTGDRDRGAVDVREADRDRLGGQGHARVRDRRRDHGLGGIVEVLLGVEAARKSLEAVARPINAVRPRSGGAAPVRAR